MKEYVVEILEKVLNGKLKREEIKNLIEVPPQQEMGDFAFPCFSLAKIEKKSPLVIAQDLVEKIRKNLSKEVSGVELKSAYVNFFIDKKFLAEKVLKESTKKGYGLNKKNKPLRIGMEYPSPNTNKPLHVGHLRNIALGESVSKIIEFSGDKPFHLNLFNDRGILISKSMVGYERYGENKTPESEKIQGDFFVGKYYVLFSKESAEKPELEEIAKEKLRKWESGDKETLLLWKKMNSWAYSGMQKTFNKFGLSKIDKTYYESDIYLNGKEIIEEGLKKGLFQKREDGAVFIDLKEDGLDEKILLRPDGTAVYMTTDLYLAKRKIEDFKLDSSYYVVGNDQDYHFKVLFNILNKLGMKKDWRHLSYGMVILPTGKMKSREGNAVSAEELIEETKIIAKESLKKRNSDLSEKELEERAMKISLAAIKYFLIKIDIHKDIVFNPNEALEFEGNTGPYLLYSYARASSILRKIKSKKSKLEIFDLSKEESALLTKIGNFPNTVKKAYEYLSPNLIANYAFELSQTFNEFYHAHTVIGSKEEIFRLKLIEALRNVLKKSLNLLGIQELEEM